MVRNAQYGLSANNTAHLSARFGTTDPTTHCPVFAKGTLLFAGRYAGPVRNPEDRPTLYFNYFLDTELPQGDDNDVCGLRDSCPGVAFE